MTDAAADNRTACRAYATTDQTACSLLVSGCVQPTLKTNKTARKKFMIVQALPICMLVSPFADRERFTIIHRITHGYTQSRPQIYRRLVMGDASFL
jgi:hypothetical protein